MTTPRKRALGFLDELRFLCGKYNMRIESVTRVIDDNDKLVMSFGVMTHRGTEDLVIGETYAK